MTYDLTLDSLASGRRTVRMDWPKSTHRPHRPGLAEARKTARWRAGSLRAEITWALYDAAKLLDWDIVRP